MRVLTPEAVLRLCGFVGPLDSTKSSWSPDFDDELLGSRCCVSCGVPGCLDRLVPSLLNV